MSDDVRQTPEPHDRLTRICAAMTDAFDVHSERLERDRCMVFLDDGTKGGLVLHGYDDAAEAIADLLTHVRAICRANGMNFDVVAIPDDASGLTP